MFNFIFLNESHLPEMLKLQDKMVKRLVRKDLYFGDLDLIKRRLKVDKSVVGICDGDKLIGFHVTDIPIREENLGVCLGFSEDELSHVGQIGPICLDPDYHGCGLMEKMIAPHLDILKDKGYYHVLATVSPYNYASMKYVLTHGFVIKKITKKYGGMLRAVVDVNLNEDIDPAIKIKVENNNIDAQLALLSKGFYGYGLERIHTSSNEYNIFYSI